MNRTFYLSPFYLGAKPTQHWM